MENEDNELIEDSNVNLDDNSGNGHKKGGRSRAPDFLSGGQLGGMTTTKEMPSALNMLGTPGDTPRDLSMRTILGRQTPGSIKAQYLAYYLGRCDEFNNDRGKEKILYMLALNVSDAGQGRRDLTDAITGDRRHEENKQGFGNMLQKLAWGSGKKDEQ